MLIDLSSSDLAIIDMALKTHYDTMPGNYIHCSSIIKLITCIERQMKMGRKI